MRYTVANSDWLRGDGFESYRAGVRARASQSRASTLNQQSTVEEVRRTVAASDRPIPVVYGRAQVGGKLFALDYTDGVWTAGFVFCYGEIDGFERLLLNGQPVPDAVTVNYYAGSTSQIADPLLAAAIDEYADSLVITRDGLSAGLAYVVLQYGGDVFDDWPEVVAELRGKLVYNPKTTTVEYSETPALHLRDLLSSPIYGHGVTVNDASVEAVQDYNDDATAGEVRRTSYAVLDRLLPTDDWIEVLRTYAGAFVVYRGDVAYLVPDQPAASVATFTAADMVRDSIRITKQDSSELPTVIRVRYTDTSGTEWRGRLSEPALLNGVAAGIVPRRESVVSLPGVNRHSQAYREAVERLNKLWLRDLVVTFTAFDIGMTLEMGDVITVSHPLGLTGKLLRVDEEPVETSPGRWRIVAVEYDPAAYSGEIRSQPSYTDGNLPSTSGLPRPTGLTVTETTSQLQTGKYASRLVISWNPPADVFITGHAVTVTDDLGDVVYSANTSDNRVSTPALREQVPYTVQVTPYSPLLLGSDPATAVVTIVGKTAVPDAPASLSGFEVGGQVRLSWPQSTDVDAERYELRYGAVGGDWDSATVLDIVDGLRLVTNEVPAGEWAFYVKTIDSIQQRSVGSASTTLTVTLDDDAFTAGTLQPLGGVFGAMANMHQSIERRGAEYSAYYAVSGETWADLFGGAAMNTFTDPLASYQTLSAQSTYLSDVLDVVSDKSGNYSAGVDVNDFGNGITPEIGVQPDGGSYSYFSQLAVQATGRYARVRVQDSADPFVVYGAGGFVRADIVAKEETGTGTSAASGATTIALSKEYAAARSIIVMPEGTSARTWVWDNIQLDNGGVTTFDVYIFDSSGAQVATPFRWQWKGV